MPSDTVLQDFYIATLEDERDAKDATLNAIWAATGAPEGVPPLQAVEQLAARLAASEAALERAEAAQKWADALDAWTVNALYIAADRRIPSADMIADGEEILTGLRAALAASSAEGGGVMNPHEAACPHCGKAICLRCVALDKRVDPDGLDGCEDCERGVRRTERAKRVHIARDHAPAAQEARDGE